MAANNGSGAAGQKQESLFMQIVLTYMYIAVWIGLSAAVILINKYVLAYSGFPFPIALTLIHMAFCATLAFLLIKLGVSDTVHMDSQTYTRCVLPIAALFSGTLWMGNAAYLYLSVAFIQMIKALMPAAVYTSGILLGTETYSTNYALNMVVVTIGVAVASYGELNFNLTGVIFQCSSIATESTRLVLIQILLQQRGIKLNPITTLYYIAPACFGFLLIPFSFIEAPRLFGFSPVDFEVTVNVPVLLASAASAFCLNMAVFLLIGKSSALTMNVAGVIKDWLLILLSVMMYASPVSGLQLGGYALAFGGVCWYNYLKYKSMQAKAADSGKLSSDEKAPLMEQKEMSSMQGSKA
uniref:Sugar phosphate transporter domain-containing protein n=1 Tax=Chlamydomonas euryale TaxID=1486919 RepID=A0A7R9Z8N2_9CHLO|mmetsp:Transcript_8371/g.25295  ORF Transcript_8371/g.25295 Transcript_8371/m.25295 type:complete len:353 (+) Transcript_8371:296-1354(+)